MKNLIFLLLTIFSFAKAYSQILKGTVLDLNTKEPITFAVIYFNGTFAGTNSDKDGNFNLDISKIGALPLTINALGYSPLTINDWSVSKSLTVYLTPKVFELNEVVINVDRGVVKKEREKNLKQFRKQFLGDTPNARNCKIINENDITLRLEKDTLKAFSAKPILIENMALGYKITIFLYRFEYIPNGKLMNFAGEVFFNEDLSSKDSQRKKFQRNRKNTYQGSRMHFFKTLWDNTLNSSGFTITDSLNNPIILDSIVNKSNGSSKFFKHKGNFYIKFEPNNEKSQLTISKDSTYFDQNGSSAEGILFWGKIGKQRIADYLPREYIQELDKNQPFEKPMQSSEDSIHFSLPDRANSYTFLRSEKIFLHIDRPNYMQGDTIWFKAYCWYGVEQVPDTISKILYVDLLNPEGKVEQKRKLLIENGTSFGEFCLDKTIGAGKYTLRAYTNLMHNPNAGEPFYQTVSVNATEESFQVECDPVIIKSETGDSLKVAFRFYQVDEAGDLRKEYSHKVDYALRIGDQVLRTDQALAANIREQLFKWPLPVESKDSTAILEISVKDGGLSFEKQFRIPLKENLDLQFFPEGGKMVEGVENKVAFKAIGTDGLSREVKGVIRDEKDEVVTSFESLHKGMGCFFLKPEANKRYTAKLEFNHQHYAFPLPKATKKGSLMTVRSEENKKSFLSIRYGPKEADTAKYVVGSAYGKIRFTASAKVTGDSCRFEIPMEMLPEGICRITMLGEDFKPECERLIYADQGQRFNIEVKPDSIAYGKRSKVTISVKAFDQDGEAVQGDLSLAVVDKDQVNSTAGIRGICAYKLLESELKGTIEDAGFYFKEDSLNYKALDLLMLTQGYREFITDTSALNKQKYLPEIGFTIAGKLKLDGNKSKRKDFSYRDYSITALSSQSKYVNQTGLDSTGGFSFHLPLIKGKPLFLLQAKSPKQKRVYSEIVLNDTIAPPSFPPPPFQDKEITSAKTFESIQQLQEAKRIERSKSYNGAAMHFNLPEVTVKAKDKQWYTRFEDEAKKIVDMDSLDPTGKKYGNIIDLLEKDFGGRRVYLGIRGLESITLPSTGKTEEWFPVYLINGRTYFNGGEDKEIFLTLIANLSYLKVNEIKRIMVLPPGNIPLHYASDAIKTFPIFQSMVVMETYSKDNFYRGDPDGSKTFMVDGLDFPRVFYSPRYEGPNKNNPVYDSRATVYWNPSVRTDSDGQAKVEFYTSDHQSKLDVIIKGVEMRNGNPGEGRITINASKH